MGTLCDGWRRIAMKKKKAPRELTQSLKSGCYRQLIQTKDKVFVFKPIKSASQAEVSTFVIPITQVHAMRLLPMQKICD
jgi:hypothetical protein